ncbi:MAG TPA: MFS transporter [Actinomycetota bacterium]|nr:MFS transporter [Actinomycetota bacterium]
MLPTLSRRAIVAAVGVLFAIQLATALLPFGLGALAPLLRDRFDLSRGEVGLAITAVFTSVALLSIPMGHLADRVGVAASLTIATALVAVAMIGMAAADSYAMLLAALAVGGVGYAAVTPSTNKGILATVPPARRGRAMGVKQMGVTAGGMVAAAVLPASVLGSGWSSTMLVTSMAVALVGTAGASAYRLLVSDGRSLGPPASGRRAAAPARRLLALGAVVGVMIAAQHAVGTYLALFLVDERHVRITTAAAALTLLHGSGTVARLAWGYVSDRLPRGRLPTIALIGASAVLGLVALAAVGPSLPRPAMLALVVLLGISTQGGNAVYQTALAEQDESRAGRASGIGMSLGFAGAIVVPPAFGAAVDAVGSYTLPFLAVAVGVGAASIAALRLATRAPVIDGSRLAGAIDGQPTSG